MIEIALPLIPFWVLATVLTLVLIFAFIVGAVVFYRDGEDKLAFAFLAIAILMVFLLFSRPESGIQIFNITGGIVP